MFEYMCSCKGIIKLHPSQVYLVSDTLCLIHDSIVCCWSLFEWTCTDSGRQDINLAGLCSSASFSLAEYSESIDPGMQLVESWQKSRAAPNSINNGPKQVKKSQKWPSVVLRLFFAIKFSTKPQNWPKRANYPVNHQKCTAVQPVKLMHCWNVYVLVWVAHPVVMVNTYVDLVDIILLT